MPTRRGFLQGLFGATLALPMLESVAYAGPGAKPRFVCFFTCNGVNMDGFWPTQYGQLTSSSFNGLSTQPLNAWASKLLIPRGIHAVPRGFGWDESVGDDHANGMAHKLTAQPCGSSTFALGESVDQAIARTLNPPNTPSLTLQVGRPDSGVTGTISYMGADQPVTPENNPWYAYRDLVGLSDLSDEEHARLIGRRQSILDLVRVEYRSLLERRLSKNDREKLDMHFSAVRDLEVAMDSNGLIPCQLDPARAAEIEGIDPNTVSYDSEFATIGRMQMDVLAMAIACGKTQAATLLWGSGAGGPTYTWGGMDHDYNHHKLSHGNTADDDSGSDVPGYEQMLWDIDRWHAEQFAYLLGRLDAYDEGNGTVLDNSCVLWANELSHGKDHDWRDLPFIQAGSCCGYFKQGEYIKVTVGNEWGDTDDTRNDNDAPHNKLLTTIMNAMGISETHFGSPAFGRDGEFDELKA